MPFWDVLLVDPANSKNTFLIQGSAASGLGADVLSANGTLIGTGSQNNITAASGTWAQIAAQLDDGTALGNWTVKAVGVGEGGYGPTGPTYGQPIADISSLTVGSAAAVAAVPEPSTWAMMVLGFAGLGLISYRRTRRKSGLNFRFA
ncbi:MAG: PEP-CTERM sorting domain-containing protein [Pseudolabrys sp.]|nr:PEP-CTERM sorting domain-containing protein [Pseudolabrys sp.]